MVSRIAKLFVVFAMVPIGALAQNGPSVIQDWVECLSNSFNTEYSTTTYTIESPSAGVYDASIVELGKTIDRYGLLRLKWDQRQVISLRILESKNTEHNEYLLSDIEGYVELRAPWGAWHLESDRTPDLPLLVPHIGSPIQIDSCN